MLPWTNHTRCHGHPYAARVASFPSSSISSYSWAGHRRCAFCSRCGSLKMCLRGVGTMASWRVAILAPRVLRVIILLVRGIGKSLRAVLGFLLAPHDGTQMYTIPVYKNCRIRSTMYMKGIQEETTARGRHVDYGGIGQSKGGRGRRPLICASAEATKRVCYTCAGQTLPIPFATIKKRNKSPICN
ncbi:hypothetical protein BDY19DRAFT_703273 [Irpex rosettiformis]|uniref:Uncharacterized protein n=1 Tax=Irpex rosettiformis TaxID=378272 RepID=A0ACB8TMY2_9APHY|nr:hypothetical protein BDY19DRAFT_703273 [Irpex rosettiformis]